MKITKRDVHEWILSLLFTLMNWTVIRFTLIPELPFWKYFVVELLFAFSLKFYNFVVQKLLTSTTKG